MKRRQKRVRESKPLAEAVMSGAKGIAFALGLAYVGSLLPRAALADDAQALIQNILGHVGRCGPASPKLAPRSPECADEQTQLIRRQDDLHVSKDAINTMISKQLRNKKLESRWPDGKPWDF
jgi:hypothetical protein